MTGRAGSRDERQVIVIKEPGPREAADMSAEVMILVGRVARVMTEPNNRARLIALRRVIDQLTHVEMSVYLLYGWLDERIPARPGSPGKRQGSVRRGAGASGGAP